MNKRMRRMVMKEIISNLSRQGSDIPHPILYYKKFIDSKYSKQRILRSSLMDIGIDPRKVFTEEV